MADTKKWLLGCGGLFVGGSLFTCCGGAGLLYFSPSLLVWLVTEDTPTVATPTAPDPAAKAAIVSRLCTDLAHSGQTTLTGDELARLMASDDEPVRLRLTIDSDDKVCAEGSFELEPGSNEWINLRGKGTWVMAHGWFEKFGLDEFAVAGWDLGTYTRGQELSMQANQNLAQQRAQRPEDFAALDSFDRIAVEGGKLALTVKPGAELDTCVGVPIAAPVPSDAVAPPSP